MKSSSYKRVKGKGLQEESKGKHKRTFSLEVLGWVWNIELMQVDDLHKDMDTSTDGLCIYAENKILIRQVENTDYNFDTLVHELTHATLHIFRNHSGSSILEEDVCVATPFIIKSIMEQWDKIPNCCKFKPKTKEAK